MKRIFVFLAALALLLALPGSALAAEEFTAQLSGDAEVPPVDTEGSGSATVTISDDGTEIAYQVSYSGLSGDVAASHIHFGGADVAGGVILPLAHGPSPFSGTLTEADLTPVEGGPQTFEEALDAIRAGETYVNLHTAANPGGEIRGQLVAAGTMPPTSTDPSGGGLPLGLLGILLAIAAAATVLAARRLQGAAR